MVDPEPLPQRFGVVEEPARDHGRLVPEPLEDPQQRLRALVEGQIRREVVEHAGVEARQEGDPLAQALVVIHLAHHRPARDRRDRIEDPVGPRQLVDDLDADERRVHVHDHEPLAPSQERFLL